MLYIAVLRNCYIYFNTMCVSFRSLYSENLDAYIYY